MRGVNYCRVLLFLVTFVGSYSVFSADYVWTGKISSTPYSSGSSPSAACNAMKAACYAQMSSSFPNRTIAFLYASRITDPSFQCHYSLTHNSTGQVTHADMTSCNGLGATAQRSGDVCPVNTVYVGSSGECVSTACEQNWSGGEKVFSASQGQCVKYPNLSPQEYCTWSSGKANSTETTINSNSPNGPSQYVDNTKCVSTNTKSDCVSRVNTDGDGAYRCKVTGQYTGDYNPNGSNMPDGYCPSGDCEEPPPPEPDIPTPTPTEYNDTEPCIYQSNGFGGLTCTSSTKNETEGTSNCGTVNGVWGCQNSPPSNNGIEIVSDVNSTTNADGSTTTTKTDTATTTACKGIGQCTTSTSTTTTTTVKDGNGNTTSVSGSCTGPQCPDTNTNPDGNGDGFGDCVGDDCGDGEGDGLVSGEACDAEVVCEGDAVNCAILRAQKNSTCADEEYRDYELVREDIETDVLGDAYKLAEDEVDAASMFSMGTRFLPAACPAPQQLSLPSIGKTVALSFEPLCDFASALSYIVVAMASLFFAVYVGRSFGGE